MPALFVVLPVILVVPEPDTAFDNVPPERFKLPEFATVPMPEPLIVMLITSKVLLQTPAV